MLQVADEYYSICWFCKSFYIERVTSPNNKGLFAIVLLERTVHNLNHPNDGVFLKKLFSCTKLTIINDNSKDFPPAPMPNVRFFQYEITMKKIEIYKQALVDRLKEVQKMY